MRYMWHATFPYPAIHPLYIDCTKEAVTSSGLKTFHFFRNADQ